jgi:hypothetical protein
VHPDSMRAFGREAMSIEKFRAPLKEIKSPPVLCCALLPSEGSQLGS